MLKQRSSRRHPKLPSKKIPQQLYLYQFPVILGLEDISSKLNSRASENIFGALLHGFTLRPITNEEDANEAERMFEYLNHAFEENISLEIDRYRHILFMLIKEYDNSQHIRASDDMPPHEFLKALLIEDEISQKSLVPDCFHSESQVSEFLHQKKGRTKLKFEQAQALGKKFNVDPLNFLRGIV